MAEINRNDVNAPYYLAKHAFDIALKHIQDTLGVTSGDLAAQFWSGRDYAPVLSLTTYARAEIEQQAMGARATGKRMATIDRS